MVYNNNEYKYLDVFDSPKSFPESFALKVVL